MTKKKPSSRKISDTEMMDWLGGQRGFTWEPELIGGPKRYDGFIHFIGHGLRYPGILREAVKVAMDNEGRASRRGGKR